MKAGVRAALVLVIAMFMLVPMTSAATSSPTGEIHDNVDQVSNLRLATPDLGTHDVFADMQTDDTNYDALTEVDNGGAGVDEDLSVTSLDTTYRNWDTETGTTPFIDAQDEPTNWIHEEKSSGATIGWFQIEDAVTTQTGLTVTFYFWCYGMDTNDLVQIWCDWTGSGGGALEDTLTISITAYGELSVQFSTTRSYTEVNSLRFYLYYQGVGGGDDIYVDHVYVNIYKTGASNYELDIEVAWTSIDYTESQAQLRIYPVTGGGWPAEDIKVDIWTGTWTNVFADLTPDQFNEVDIESYVTDATVEIRFLGGTETGDTTQDTWEIDYVEIYTYSLEWAETRTDTLNIASAAIKQAQVIQDDTLSLASTAVKEVAKVLEDTLNIASTHSTVGTFIKMLADTLSIASVSSVVVGKLLVDTLNFASTESYKIVVQKLVEDTLNFASVYSFEIGKVLTDTLQLSSTTSKVVAILVVDTLILASVSSSEVQKLLIDTLQFASVHDAVKNPEAGPVQKTVTDTLLIGSAASTVGTFIKSVDDTLAIASAISYKVSKLLTDELVIASAVALSVGKVVFDTLLLDSAVSMTYDLHRTVTDVLAISNEISSPSFSEEETPAGGVKTEEVAPIVKVIQQMPMFGWGILVGTVVLGFVYRVYMIKEDQVSVAWDRLLTFRVPAVRETIERWIREFMEGY